MEVLIIASYIVIAVFGIAVGFILKTRSINGNVMGTLKMRSDPDGSYLFVELDDYPEVIMKQKTVLFRTDNSQK